MVHGYWSFFRWGSSLVMNPPMFDRIWEFKWGVTDWLKKSHGLISQKSAVHHQPSKHQPTKLTKSLVSFTGPLENILTEITVLKFSGISWFSNPHKSPLLNFASFHLCAHFGPRVRTTNPPQRSGWSSHMGTLRNHVCHSPMVSWHLWCSDPSISLRNENARNCLKSSSHLTVCNITIYHKCNLMLLVVVSTLPQSTPMILFESSSWHSGISPQWSQHRFGKKPRVKPHRKTHWNLWKHV